MTIPANLYADKIFAEHPTALWSLDDTVSGVAPLDISAKNIAVSKNYGIEAASYGTDIFPGYYLADSSTPGSIYINDSGIPMVYGASNITHIYPIENCPSIIFPAFGFLNESGKNREMTFEAWIKINCSSSIPKKIFGPISSNDGLYVHNGFLTLRIGQYIESYYVGEWGKPMLIDITYDFREVSLFVNSEQVINMQISLDNIDFPSILSDTGEDQDWLGFYAYEDITPISIDCVAIYPYKISSVIAKKRWVYGQAVPAPDTHSLEDNDVPVILDYQFSEYGKGYIYPDMGKWVQGSFNNLIFDENDKIKMPQYSLPSIISDDEISLSQWFDEQNRFYIDQSIGTSIVDTLESNDLYFYMTADSEDVGNIASDAYNGRYFYFNNFANIISETVAGFYGVFQSGNALPSGEITFINETLFKLQNSDGSNLHAYLYTDNALSTTYSLKYDFTNTTGDTENVYTSNVAINTNFVAGVSIPDLLSNNIFSNFFANPANLSMILFGNTDFTNTFRGKIYRFGIFNLNALSKIQNLYTDGYLDATEYSSLIDNYCTYTLIPSNIHGSFELDIAINSSWKDYIPLSYFGKNVLDQDGNQTRDLDILQFTIDYPEPSKYIEATPFIDSEIDTSKSLLKSYVYFSNVPETANSIIKPDTLTSIPIKYGKTVIPDETNWSEEKYEIVNGSIIYPPDGIDYNNLFLNILIDFNVYGILNNPISIRSLKIGSQSFNKSIETGIGTRLGKKIYPYTIVDNEKNYTTKNPISIYTGSTPYLFLTKYSGFKLLGNTFDGTRAVSIKLNEFSFDYFKISAIQFSMLSDNVFFAEDTEIVRIKTASPSIYYKIFASRVVGDTTGKTATLYATDQDDNILTKDSVLIAINGRTSELDQPTDLVIGQNEWNMINIKFINLINLGGSILGSIDFTGPFTINNVNSYRINYKNEGDRVFYNNWLEASTLYSSWDYMNNSGIYWSNVAVDVKSTIPGIDPNKIYNTYLGNNRLIVDSSIIPLKTNAYTYSVYKDLQWNTVSVEAL